LAVYRFIRELRDSDEMQIEFLEMFDRNTQASEVQSKVNEVVKSIEEFEEVIAEDVEIEVPNSSDDSEIEVIDGSSDEPAVMDKSSRSEALDTEKTDNQSIEINDKISTEPSLADRFQGHMVKSLKESVGLNDRFQFASELFDGNMEDLNNALNIIDEKADLQQALDYLEKDYSPSKMWDQNSEVYQRFINLLKRRFPLN
jgi:hypothetical protein